MARLTDSDQYALVAARRLRRAIVCQLGVASPLLAAAGCAPTPPPSTDDGGVTTNQSGESPDTGESPETGESSDGEVTSDVDTGTPEETGMMDDESESESDDGGMKLDLPPIADIPPSPSCWALNLTEDEVVAAHPDCALGPFDPNLAVVYYEVCVERPPDGDCADICPPDTLCEGMQDCHPSPWYGMCGAYETDDTCCLILAADEPVVPGRPFVVDGATRLATVTDVPRDRVAAHWLEVARGEHASIAAFARFVAILQRHGAPARLLAEALAAAVDEARHAEQTLALAARFAGRELELGPLEIDDALRGTDDLAAALRATVREGCIDETLAAHEAACLAAVAEDPQVAIGLEQIAVDEARHAALAWKFVEWALGQRPELRSVVVEVFASVAAPRVLESGELAPHDLEALALGCPPDHLRAHWRRIGLRELVGPCVVRLLGAASRNELRA